MRKRTEYQEKLLDPRWQKKRLAILERDEWACQICFDTKETLNVHHRYYNNSDPWDIPDEALVTLCVTCHEEETNYQKEAENLLLKSLKKKFFSSEIINLAEGFDYMEMPHFPHVVAGALKFLLEDKKELSLLIDRYLNPDKKDKK